VTAAGTKDAGLLPTEGAEQPARLAPLLIDALQLSQRLRTELREVREALHAAIDLVADRDQQIVRQRRTIEFQREEVRRIARGDSQTQRRSQEQAA
jgi:hypothetical protein